ncbi:MAG: choice-of-anchor B family protein [Flavobacteriales bacterium]
MKQFVSGIVLVLWVLSGMGQGQDDLNLLGNFQNGNFTSQDLYGYVDSAGNEYALLISGGIRIVNIEDPSNPQELYHSPYGARDVKVYNDHLYAVADGFGGDTKIIDLSSLPDTNNLNDTIHPVGAHNLFIDDQGRLFLFGASSGVYTVPIYDLSQDPMDPFLLGGYDPSGAHDGYVRNDTLYNANIGAGRFEIVDVSDPGNPLLLGSHSTPGKFTHACWLSEDGDHLFTMDELTGDFLASYDVSDPSNIQELDRTGSGIGDPSSPHNVYIDNGYLIGAYYADGVVVWDASRPQNMVRVAHYDTYPASDSGGYTGCWGAYPWLPSGNIIASDRQNGLFILGPQYERASHLEGTVTDASDGTPVQNAELRIEGLGISASSDLVGDYATGYDSSGSFQVIYDHPYYHADTLDQVPLARDSLTIRDVQLDPYPTYDITVEVLNEGSQAKIEGAKLRLKGEALTLSGQSNAAGYHTFYEVPQASFLLNVAKWGFYPYCSSLFIDQKDTIQVFMEEGYGDDFAFDHGWQSSGYPYNEDGWVRKYPDTTFPSLQPATDATNDCGGRAFTTGANPSVVDHSNDGAIDTLISTLSSPPIDASAWQDLYVRVEHWYDTTDTFYPGSGLYLMVKNGPNAPVDTFTIQNGTASYQGWQTWSFQIPYSPPYSDSLFVAFLAGNPDGDARLRTAVDRFRIGPDSLKLGEKEQMEGGKRSDPIGVTPNPYEEKFRVHWKGKRAVRASVYDLQGRLLRERRLTSEDPVIRSSGWSTGIRILILRDPETGERIGQKRLVKVRNRP